MKPNPKAKQEDNSTEKSKDEGTENSRNGGPLAMSWTPKSPKVGGQSVPGEGTQLTHYS